MNGPLIQGVSVAAVTPCRAGERIADLGATFEMIDFFAGHGVRAIAFMGSTGEFLHYDNQERTRVIEQVVKRSPVPVIVNVAHSSLAGAVELARHATDAGAKALLLMPPYFFPYKDEEVEAYFVQFAESLRDPAPLLLYNIPFFTTPLNVEIAARLLTRGLYAGIKDSSGKTEYLGALLKTGLDRTFLVGNDRVFVEMRQAGAHGVISGVASAMPELMTAIDRAILAGNHAATVSLRVRLDEFIAAIDPFPTPLGVREGAALRGVRTGPPMLPLGAATCAKLEQFRGWFREWLPQVERECKSV
jgi:dihydrodipicolinate synthase/N-acetylneuraminate lyase